MEFIKIARRRSLFSSFLHILLNVLLVVAIWVSITVTESPWIGIILVFVSKWRVLAVRPRFWMANLKSNLTDFIVCLGLTVIMWLAGGQNLIAQSVIAVIYAVWLIVIKPGSSRWLVKTQAITAVFIGFFALFAVSYGWPLVAVVLVAWLIGYSSLRHVMLTGKNQQNIELFSIIWGLILAEVAWLFCHWTVGYDIFGVSAVAIPQVSIITGVMSFLLFSFYFAYDNDKKINFQEIAIPIIFSVAICVILMVFFSSVVEF